MSHRKRILRPRSIPPRDIFPTDPWVFEAVRFDSKLAYEFAGQAETTFALSNGYLGMRGMIEEGIPVKEPGVFLNGFYEHRPISYGEQAYGFPRVGQSILNCPDGTVVKLFVDDEPFSGGVQHAADEAFGQPRVAAVRRQWRSMHELGGDHDVCIGILCGELVFNRGQMTVGNETRRMVLRRMGLPVGVTQRTSRFKVPS